MSLFSSGTIGAYRVVEELGPVPGGHACRALDTRTGTPVVLKAVPLPSGSSGLAARIAEIRRLSRIDHPGIPAVYEASEGDGVVLLALGNSVTGHSLPRGALD